MQTGDLIAGNEQRPPGATPTVAEGSDVPGSDVRTSPWMRWLVAIFIVAALLRLTMIKRTGLWPDEIFSLAMATGHSIEHSPKIADPGKGDYVQLSYAAPATAYHKYVAHDNPPAPPSRVIRAVFESDTSPPLYYLLLYTWTRVLGTGDAVLRGFSLAMALACIPVLWWLARQFGGPRAAIAACTLFALAPASVYYSIEGRMYSLLWLTTLCTTAATVQLRRNGATWPMLLLWTLAAAAGLLTHYFFSFVLAAIAGWLLLSPGAAKRSMLIFAMVLVGVLVAPWYAQIPATMAHWRVTDYWLKITPYEFNRLTTSLLLPWSFYSTRGEWGSALVFDKVHAVVFAVLLVLALIRLRSRLFTGERLLLWSCVLSACVGLVIFDAWRGTYVVDRPRYAFAGFPAALLLFGIAIAALPKWLRRGMLVAALVGCVMADWAIYKADIRCHPVRQVAGILSQRARADDVIIVSSVPSGVTGIARYLQTRPGEEPGFVSWVEQFKQFTVPDDVLRLAKGRKRIILVRMHEVWAEPTHEDWLWRNNHFAEKIEFEGARIDFFEPPNKQERF